MGKKPNVTADAFKVIIDASATLPDKEQAQEAARGDFIAPAEEKKPRRKRMSKKEREEAKAAQSRANAPAILLAIEGAKASFAVPVDLLDDLELSAADKLVMISLYRYIGDDGLSTPPAKSVLARQAGITETWVYKTLRELAQRGYIEGLPDGGKRLKKYRLKYSTQL